MKTLRLAFSTVALAGVLCASTSLASIAFYAPVLNGYSVDFANNAEPTGNDGLFFTLNSAITVTALDYYAPGSSAGSPVGLYDATTYTLLASTTVSSTAGLSSSDNRFLSVAITPITLTPGDVYAVSGFFDVTLLSPNYGATADGGVLTSSAINFSGYKYDYNSSLDLPNNGYAPAIFGPNFEYNVVPEPTTIISGALMLLPFGASTVRILRRRQAAG